MFFYQQYLIIKKEIIILKRADFPKGILHTHTQRGKIDSDIIFFSVYRLEIFFLLFHGKSVRRKALTEIIFIFDRGNKGKRQKWKISVHLRAISTFFLYHFDWLYSVSTSFAQITRWQNSLIFLARKFFVLSMEMLFISKSVDSAWQLKIPSRRDWNSLNETQLSSAACNASDDNVI